MPHVDSHTAGTINWVDMVSTDLDAATAFYTGLFGWETEDMPMPGGGGVYRFFRIGGRDAAAAGTMPPEMLAQGIPSHWNVWVAADADETVAKAAAAGGQVLMEPMTLGPSGRLAMIADPGGAAVGVWEAAEHIGARVVDEPGAMTWYEVNTGPSRTTSASTARCSAGRPSPLRPQESTTPPGSWATARSGACWR